MPNNQMNNKLTPSQNGKIELTDEEWREVLTREQYYILREKGTEPPYTGEFTDHNEKGIYSCAGCGLELFKSENKYHSGCGWPSFFDELQTANIIQKLDTTHNMRRIELLCSRCEGHLGHIFEDGPEPTGKRYCINSAALKFEKE